jgi:hypothetical protein
MPLWLVTASWDEDEAERSRRFEVSAPTEGEAIREVAMILPSRPSHVEAIQVRQELAPDLPPGQVREVG